MTAQELGDSRGSRPPLDVLEQGSTRLKSGFLYQGQRYHKLICPICPLLMVYGGTLVCILGGFFCSKPSIERLVLDL